MKQCTRCFKEKKDNEFYTEKRNKNGLTSACKECIDLKNYQYRKSERGVKILTAHRKSEKMKAWFREYRKRPYRLEKRKKYDKSIVGKKSKSECCKRYFANNKEKFNEYNKNKKKTDINFKLRSLLRTRICKVIAQNKRVGSAVKDLGCTLEELKNHLESSFAEGMTWENHGLYGWHIDHIKPLTLFDLTNREQFLEAVNYKNLQPLWAIDNLVKNNKYYGDTV
jgi:hypothetical protein